MRLPRRPTAGGCGIDNQDTTAHDLIPFAARDCALISLATGITADGLRELLDGLMKAPEASLYHHFWGRLLRPHFDEPEYLNDFASWVYHSLREKALAERMSLIDPTDFADMEEVRNEMVELIEQRLDESESLPVARVDRRFHFIRAQLVLFDPCVIVEHPAKLSALLPRFSTSSLYYHFIDARRRNDGHRDDLSSWLGEYGDEFVDVVQGLAAVDPYFSSLRETRRRIADVFAERFDASWAEATTADELPGGSDDEGWDKTQEYNRPDFQS